MITGRGRGRPPDPVIQVAQILASTDVDLTDLDGPIDVIVREKSWLSRKQHGGAAFQTFAELAIAPEPNGLGIPPPRKCDQCAIVSWPSGTTQNGLIFSSAQFGLVGGRGKMLSKTTYSVVFGRPLGHTAWSTTFCYL